MALPFVFINAAMSADGKLSTVERRQIRISGDLDFARVDELRASSDAVMVGIGTVLTDDPSLTVKSADLRQARRERGLEENPARIVVDSKARVSPDADIFRKGEGLRIVAVSKAAPEDKVDVLRRQATVITAGEDRVDLALLLSSLKDMGIDRLMVEGGARLNWGLLNRGLVDEIYTFVGNMIIGGSSAPTLADGEGFPEKRIQKLELLDTEVIGEGILLHWKVPDKT
jgi:2,5-diamino-6-(ribosylamino)-4(3H)-pyrimidinone 5'-phosphate reductase